MTRFRPETRTGKQAGTMAYWFDISASRSPMVQALHAYWHARCVGDRLPRRQDIEPADLKPLLPYMMVVDVIGEPMRVRYRLVGTKVAVATGLDFTGRFLDELIPDGEEKPWEDYYRIARDKRVAVLGDAAIPVFGGQPFLYEFGIFPLSADGRTVTQCVSLEDYGTLNARLGELVEKTTPWRMRIATG
jgi:hypothetical protein